MNDLVMWLYGHKSVSKRLWITAGILISQGLFLLAMSLSLGLVAFVPGCILAMLGCFMVATGFPTDIPSDPPQVGILTVWGQRTNVVLTEKQYLLANYFPLYLNINLVPITATNHDIIFDVSCKAEEMKGDSDEKRGPTIGGSVNVKVSVTFVPDYQRKENGKDVGGERLIQYINKGKEHGVIHIIEDIVKEAVRDTALNFTWEEFAFLKLPLSAEFITLIADAKFRKLKVPSADVRKIKPADYKTSDELEEVDDVLEYFEQEKEQRHKQVEREITHFLQVIVANGVGDIKDLGIKILRFNVTHIVAIGDTAKAADEAAAEKQQRVQERRDIETEHELAQMYLDFAKENGAEMSVTDAFKMARVNRGRAQEVQVNSSGNPLLDAAAILKTNNK